MRNANIKEFMFNREHRRKVGLCSEKGSNAGKAPTLRVSCPICYLALTNILQMQYIVVGRTTRKATCKQGHTFPIGGHSYHTEK
jgi:hypothetical protein